MTLEHIAKTYGMTDYIDHNTGYIYALSEALEHQEEGKLKVPVYTANRANLIGYATMDKPN